MLGQTTNKTGLTCDARGGADEQGPLAAAQSDLLGAGHRVSE